MKKFLLFFIMIQSISIIAKTEIDTITNWQLYKDNKILFKSNELQKNLKIGVINFKEGTKVLNFNISYDFFREKTFKKIEFIVNNKVIQYVEDEDYSSSVFKIKKEQIIQLFEKYKNIPVLLKYYDKINPKGVTIGRILIK